MGWKVFSILIQPAAAINNEVILQTLGFSDFTKIDDEPYEVAIYPDKNKTYLGYYKDILIISDFSLPDQFFSSGLTEVEKKLIAIFPTSEICAVSLHSGTNYWAYALIKNGKKIRARMGCADTGTTLDYGEPMKEELELLSNSKIDNSGQRLYCFEDNPKEVFSEDQIGENFVFEIYKRYTGESLDSNDELLFDTHLSGYETTRSKNVFNPKRFLPEILIKDSKPWWKFW